MFVVNETGLTIKTVADRTGISVHTLRAWERRYGVPSPNRGQGNRYRLYDEQDIADVLFMKQLVESGVAPAQASARLRQRQTKAVIAPASEMTQPIVSLQTTLLNAFAESDVRTALHTLDEAFALVAPEQVALAIVEPTMREIGERWMRNEMTVWQEHLASNLIQQKLFSILQSQPALPKSAPILIAACAPQEEHQLGLVILSLMARRQGWRVEYLGQGTPLSDIVDLSRKLKPNAIAVSVSTVVGLAALLPWLDPVNRPATLVVLGGVLLNRVPSLRDHLPGEYLSSDAVAAVGQLASVKLRAEYWSPSPRAHQAVKALLAQRLRIMGEAVAMLTSSIGAKKHPHWDTSILNYSTQFLIDTLACALAFDAPELVDDQRQWLRQIMPVRMVPSQMIDKHLEIFGQVLNRTLGKDQARLFKPLIERMQVA